MRILKNCAVHNIVAHPIMAILHIFGLYSLGDFIHDATIPKQKDVKNDLTGLAVFCLFVLVLILIAKPS